MANMVVTKDCTITHGPSTGEKLKAGHVLVSPNAALLAEITAAGGTTRASVSPGVNLREYSGEAFGFCSNASG
jgi:hypothetical protein